MRLYFEHELLNLQRNVCTAVTREFPMSEINLSIPISFFLNRLQSRTIWHDRVHVVRKDPYLEGTRWVARCVENLAPVGTGSRLVRVHNGPLFHKLLQAHSRSPTFPGVGASAAPCLAGVRRTQRAPIAAARRRRSTSRSLPGGQTGVEEISQRGLWRGILLHECVKGDKRGRG